LCFLFPPCQACSNFFEMSGPRRWLFSFLMSWVWLEDSGGIKFRRASFPGRLHAILCVFHIKTSSFLYIDSLLFFFSQDPHPFGVILPSYPPPHFRLLFSSEGLSPIRTQNPRPVAPRFLPTPSLAQFPTVYPRRQISSPPPALTGHQGLVSQSRLFSPN